MKSYDIKLFMDLFKRLTNKIGELEKYAGETTIAGRVSFAELSLISLIGENEKINITTLAQKYGATKGAISKMVKNLVSKNLVQKYRLPSNEKEVLLALTSVGSEIFQKKEAHFACLTKEIAAHFQSLDANQVKALFDILQSIESHIDEHLVQIEDSSDKKTDTSFVSARL